MVKATIRTCQLCVAMIAEQSSMMTVLSGNYVSDLPSTQIASSLLFPYAPHDSIISTSRIKERTRVIVYTIKLSVKSHGCVLSQNRSDWYDRYCGGAWVLYFILVSNEV